MSQQDQPLSEARAASPSSSGEELERSGGYRYYLEDRPVLVPLVTLVLGALCLATTVFSNVLRDVMLGGGASPDMMEGFNRAIAWSVAFVVGIMVLATIFLLVHLADASYRRIRRRPTVCPRCGLAETRQVRFAHQPVKGTDWENITCPECATTWHGRR